MILPGDLLLHMNIPIWILYVDLYIGTRFAADCGSKCHHNGWCEGWRGGDDKVDKAIMVECIYDVGTKAVVAFDCRLPTEFYYRRNWKLVHLKVSGQLVMLVVCTWKFCYHTHHLPWLMNSRVDKSWKSFQSWLYRDISLPISNEMRYIEGAGERNSVEQMCMKTYQLWSVAWFIDFPLSLITS